MPPCLAILLLLPSPARALAAQSSIRFEAHDYAYDLVLDGIPACPGLLGTLYSMDTMRRLTSFVDRVEMLHEQPTVQTVRVQVSVFGFHTALIYDRLLFPGEGTIVLRLLRQEGHLPIVSFPTAFEADFHVVPAGEGLRLDYTQRAATEHGVTVPHQLFLRTQLRIFEHRLTSVVTEACP